MGDKTAFVIMPIGSNGSEEARTYEALYANFLEKPLKESGFSVTRADKVSKGGSIFKDIIKRLLEADIVIADLSSLNANVMLELGIRYAVKKSGTILICDRSKTPDLPFDLKDYRTIFYDDTRDGGAALLRGVRDFAVEAISNKSDESDSPVFHHYKSFFGEATDAVLRDEIFLLREKLSEQEGIKSIDQKSFSASGYDLPPIEMLAKAIAEIDEGNVPWELLAKASTAASTRDIGEFLKCVESITSLRAITLRDREYLDIYYLARRLDLRNVLPAIIEMGLAVYPDSEVLMNTKMNYLAHSVQQRERQKARDLISSKLKIDPMAEEFDVNRMRYENADLSLLSMYLDAIHKDGDDELGFRLISKLYDQMPDNTIVVRNFARAIERTRGSGEAYPYFLQAVQNCGNVDSTSARWLAVELWDRRQHRDAVEISILACMLDLDNADAFGRLANFVSNMLQPQNIVSGSAVDLASVGLTFQTLAEIIVYGQSCPNVSLEDRGLFEMAMQNADVTAEQISQQSDQIGLVSRRERADFLKKMFGKFKSQLSELRQQSVSSNTSSNGAHSSS